MTQRKARCAGGTRPKRRRSGPVIVEVELRHHIDRRALIDSHVGDALGQLRNELDRGRTGADESNAAAVEVVVVVPRRRVNRPSGEFRDAGNVGDVRLGQEPGRGDQEPRCQRLAAGECDMPALAVLVPASTLDACVEAHVPAYVVFVRDVVGVSLELGAGGEQPRPVRVRLEPVRVGGRRDVDGQAGVAVHMPRPAEVVLAFEDHEVVVAQPAQLYRRPDSPESCPDDDRFQLLRSHGPDATLLESKFEGPDPPVSA